MRLRTVISREIPKFPMMRPSLSLSGIFEVSAQVTACTFGGPRLDRLYITTSRENLPPDADPLAGALFAVDPGVAGRPVREFAG